MSEEKLDIIYQDDHYVAINKPAGLLVHPSIIDKHEPDNALHILQNQIEQSVYMIHRLDKPTSGVLIFGLSSKAARGCVAAFTAGDVQKTYLAIVRGYTDEQLVIDHPLKSVPDKIMRGREKQNKPSKPALTHIRQLAQIEQPVAVGRYPTSRYSLVEAHPKTGKMHQIRRHLKHIRHPIIGDTKYGDPLHNRSFRDLWNAHRLLLASTELEFIHPFTSSKVRIYAPLDPLFISILSAWNWLQVIPESWLTQAE
ncbi:MAG: pseudouridylate synthase [Deltaproteobacteria bacterium]|nr:pseudouridylate synthase [Deltaproteobacteria bacterium]